MRWNVQCSKPEHYLDTKLLISFYWKFNWSFKNRKKKHIQISITTNAKSNQHSKNNANKNKIIWHSIWRSNFFISQISLPFLLKQIYRFCVTEINKLATDHKTSNEQWNNTYCMSEYSMCYPRVHFYCH